MKEILRKYKKEGYSIRQLIVIGKAVTLKIPLHIITNINYSPREMNFILRQYQERINKWKRR